MSLDVDEAFALEWMAGVEQAVRESADPDDQDALLDSVTFIGRLNPIADVNPADPAFRTHVREAVTAHLAEASEPQLERIDGRVLESAGTASDGSRIFRVEIIREGDSKNGRRYPKNVLHKAVRLYEGAKAFDHHRSPDELRSSTIKGLVGHYRNVKATDGGLEGDLHLLPSATHTAEALDATIAAQNAGLPPLVGISHDAMTVLKPIHVGGRRIQEAVAITAVNSADVVADPAAGGKATRVLAGGIDQTDPESNQEEDVTVTSEAVLAVLQNLTPEQLASAGLSKATESTEPQHDTGVPADTVYGKASFMGRTLVTSKVTEANLPASVATQLLEALPERITESDVDAQIAMLKATLAMAERANLVPSVTATVTKESYDKKKEGIDGFFDGNGKGYRSFREMFIDVTGIRGPRTFDEDFNRVMLRESIGQGYDSAIARSTESLTTSSFDVLLADSITRRLITEYQLPSLQSWRRIVSSTPAVTDFRTQRRGRFGGYGTLPTVNQGQPYQPLTSPADEEATYAVTKKGGTEDLTLEMIANDDIGAIQQIPRKLGRAAAQTLYRFVWDFIRTNATCTYDSTALFHANHNNTDAAALSDSALDTARRKMRTQAAYGDSVEILDIIPSLLVVPPHLESTAWRLCTSVVQVTSNADATVPNLHQGMAPLVVPYFSDTNDWFVVADPSMVPTIEVGFYRGQQEPELFTQSDPNVGSMFNSDSLTYKIRQIYHGAIIDHRGFYSGTQ